MNLWVVLKRATSRLCGTKPKRESHLTVGTTVSNKLDRKVSQNLCRVQDPTLIETWIKGLTIKLKLPNLKIVA